MLVSSSEPSVPQHRLETALAFLGHRRTAVDEALASGVVRVADGQIDVVDVVAGRTAVRRASDRTRRTAHLALACAQLDGLPRPEARSLFERVSHALDGPSHVLLLTRQEQHVATLAASGAPVREIASAACLSPKTVEYHLTRIYRKLGVRSKAELAGALHA